MSENTKDNLKYCGQGVKIHPLVKIVKPQVIEIGDNSMIDDFTFINGGTGVKIGKHVYIACFTSIIGGGKLVIGDYATIGYGTKIITATDTYHGSKTASRTLSIKHRTATKGRVIIENGVLIGGNVVIHPNVRIGEGAIIGSNSQVLKDVNPRSINVGSP